MVAFVSTEVASRVAGQPVRALLEQAMAGDIHVSDTVTSGEKLICLASLLELP